MDCPCGKPRYKCWTHGKEAQDVTEADFHNQYPNQRNEILRKGPAAFGYDLAGRA